MRAETKTGHLLSQAGSPKPKSSNISYHQSEAESNEKRAKQISERLAQMPRLYRPVYERAIKGKSLRAAVNAFCLECISWQRIEVTLCTDLACPLYAVRPYQGIPQNARKGQLSGAESKKSCQR
jgi:hypothetical protein